MNHARSRPGRLSAAVRSAVPAYAFPAVTAYLNAQLIPDSDLAARLEVASYSTIAIPSAVAAVLVTLWLHSRTPPEAPSRGRVARTVAIAALVCVALAGAVSAVLIGNGLQDLSILQFTLGSAALGGGLSARKWVRSRARRTSTRATARAERTSS
ncbi:hypothetical protein [Actinocrispum wychmicini]|uniref:Uncharacterized protein n=1 Tax=Actinocrispum wychmicini TaxID=1213861 RepID=A0A4R2JQG6_9PSEU|nr:hypothetical protein [Actinocrispum wychmicini]TCO61042.1 hypothetical protein EV192_103625 [Actinocrispum wychmicini]